MPFRTYHPPAFKPRNFTRVGKYTNSAGAEANIYSVESDTGTAPSNGDKYLFYIICDGTEKTLDLASLKTPGSGKFDLYINGVVDSSAYDDYNVGYVAYSRAITLSIATIGGLNAIELRMNGKNGASSGYELYTYGMRLR